MPIRFLPRIAPLVLVVLIAACSTLTPYKLPIQQGNIVSSESLTKLKSGMTKNQAAQVLGTALLNDIFHANRWDYVHYLSRRGNMSEKNHVALIFEDEKLARLIGEGVPTLEPMAAPELPAVAPEAEKSAEPEANKATEPEAKEAVEPEAEQPAEPEVKQPSETK